MKKQDSGSGFCNSVDVDNKSYIGIYVEHIYRCHKCARNYPSGFGGAKKIPPFGQQHSSDH